MQHADILNNRIQYLSPCRVVFPEFNFAGLIPFCYLSRVPHTDCGVPRAVDTEAGIIIMIGSVDCNLLVWNMGFTVGNRVNVF